MTWEAFRKRKRGPGDALEFLHPLAPTARLYMGLSKLCWKHDAEALYFPSCARLILERCAFEMAPTFQKQVFQKQGFVS